jgi:hypothetical protein
MSTIVYSAGQGSSALRLAAGLSWVVVKTGANGSPQKEKIRAQAQASGASRYVLHKGQAGEATTMGLYSDPMTPSRGGKLYSLSSLFLAGILREASVERNLINVALLLEPQGAPNMRVLVYIEAGQVTRDTVLERTRAIASLEEHLAQLPGVSVFSEHAEITPVHTPITWADVAELADKRATASLLRPVPRSPVLLLCALAVALAVASWFSYDLLVRQPEKKRRALAEQAQRDQTPAYLEAVERELKTTGWNRLDLLAFVSSLRGRPAQRAGWAIEQITCDVQQCTTQWGRRGGLVTELAAALPHEILLSGDAANGNASLEKAFTRTNQERKNASLDKSDLPRGQASTTALLAMGQKMANAGVAVSLRELRPWDAIPLAEVQPPAVLLKGELELPVMPHLAIDALGLLPANVLIQSISLRVTDDSMTFTFKGNSYAQQNTP